MRSVKTFKKTELAAVLVSLSLLTACGGGGGGGSKNSTVSSSAAVSSSASVGVSSSASVGVSSSSAGSVTSGTQTVNGTATKGPLDAATVTAYALNSDGSRGEYLGMTTTGKDGAFSLPVNYKGAVALVVTGGTYTDEASGKPVTLPQGAELETLLASVEGKNSVAVTALTTIASVKARGNAKLGLDKAIAAANADVASTFGLADTDIAETIPADLSDASAAQASAKARKYGLVQAGLTQLAKDTGMSPDTVLELVRQMAEDLEDGRFDGRNNRGRGVKFALTITPQQAHAGLERAMAAFLKSAENKSGKTEVDIDVPDEEEGTLTGQATKGPIDEGTVSVYRLNEDGSRGELLASTLTDDEGNFSVPLEVTGPVAVVVTGGSYEDEATGEEVSLDENELETLVADASKPQSVAVTALTTIAAKRASANASAGLATAIASANTEVATLFGLENVDIGTTIPADLTDSDSADADAGAQAYGLAQAALSQLIETNDVSPEQLLTLVKGMAEDFSDGALDGVSSTNKPVELPLPITPAAAVEGLENARRNFLDSPENASEMAEIPRPVQRP